MPSPILSICIPTYNRAGFLKQCLDSIASQIKNPEHVEIVISDNGSSDNTQSVVEEYQKKFPFIKYIKNRENLGFDKNVLQVVEKASGDYCWLLGDDDALFKDALECLLPLLLENKYEYFLANAWGYNRELEKPAVSRPNLRISSNKFYPSLKDFVRTLKDPREMVGTFGGMSGQIFSRRVWQELAGKQGFIGSQTVHLFVILKAFRGLPALVIAKPLVKTRADNMRWDTFPGLETVKKRVKSTKNTQEWIFNLYGIPYSKTKLELKYHWDLFYSLLFNATRKTLFKNQAARNFVKKLIGK